MLIFIRPLTWTLWPHISISIPGFFSFLYFALYSYLHVKINFGHVCSADCSQTWILFPLGASWLEASSGHTAVLELMSCASQQVPLTAAENHAGRVTACSSEACFACPFRASARRAHGSMPFPGQKELYLTAVSLLLEAQTRKAFNYLLYCYLNSFVML